MADRETRKKQIVAKRQEQILKAAVEVFTARGFAAATIPEIARTAGLAAGTIYLYYPGKRELFVAVIENMIILPLSAIYENKSGQDFLTTIRAALLNRVQFMQSNQTARLISLMGEIQRDPDLRATFRDRTLQPFLKRIEQMYRQNTGAGEFPSAEPAFTVRMVAGMVIGLTMLKSIERETSPLEQMPPEKIVEGMTRFILGGVSGGLSDMRDFPPPGFGLHQK